MAQNLRSADSGSVGGRMAQNILLVDGCQVFRVGMREVMKLACPGASFTEAANFAEAYAALKHDDLISLVVMDLGLPDCDGFIGLVRVRSEFPAVPVILVSDQTDEAAMCRATEFGALGLMSKQSSVPDLVRVLGDIVRGNGCFLPPLPINDNGGDVGAIASLSPAQFRILVGLQKGLRNKQIAFEMGITEKTVKAYTTTMYRKLGVSSRTQALLLARKAFAGQNFN